MIEPGESRAWGLEPVLLIILEATINQMKGVDHSTLLAPVLLALMQEIAMDCVRVYQLAARNGMYSRESGEVLEGVMRLSKVEQRRLLFLVRFTQWEAGGRMD